jgi:hypothetical protein
MGGFSEDAVSQGVCRCKVSHPEVENGGMIASVDVMLVELLISPERHGRKAANLERVASLSGLHDPIEKPVESFSGRHGADIGSSAALSGIRPGIRHVRDRRRRCPTSDLVDDSADQQEA